MKKFRIVLATVVMVFPMLASAGCTGYVVEDGCRWCGVGTQPIRILKAPQKKVTYYLTAPDGGCKTSTAGWYDTGICGSC